MELDDLADRELLDSDPAPRPGFWRRQFGDSTRHQRIFDVLFGALMPLACLVFDPVVFRGWIMPGDGILERFRIAAYGFIGFQIVILCLWLFRGRRLRGGAGMVAGALYVGALGALALGVVMLPFSLLGIVAAGIGLLGLTPFLTSLVYLRNGIRAWRRARLHLSRATTFLVIVFGAVVVSAVPLGAERATDREVEWSLSALIARDRTKDEGAIYRLRWLAIGLDLDRLAEKYEAEQDPQERDRLMRAYYRITGEDIERRLHESRD